MLFVLNDYYQGNMYIIACIIYLLAIIVSFTLHEFAHAYTAYKCGDPTPKHQGRLTFNPLAHIDPIGFICAALFYVGWAKPVQVNPNNFKNYKRDMSLVSVMGVITNFVIAFISYGLFSVLSLINSTNQFLKYVIMFFDLLFSLNVTLAVFNFLPIPPLDGFNFLDSMTRHDNKFVNFMRKYGFWILMIILIVFSNFLTTLIAIVSVPIVLFWGLIL